MGMKQRVKDGQLLRAVWLYQLKKTASGALINYVGERKRVAPASWQRNGQDLHIMERCKLGVDLGKAHIRIRLVALIKSGLGGITWAIPKCTYWIVSSQADEAWAYARQWWAARGVPVEDGNGSTAYPDPILIDNYEVKLEALRAELLALFGGNP